MCNHRSKLDVCTTIWDGCRIRNTPMPRTYSLELKLTGRPVLVVGGGHVAARKVAALAEAGVVVRIASLSFSPELLQRQDITREERLYDADCLQDAQLVFACTDDRETNAAVAADAHRLGIWCNIADDPAACDFFVPSTLHQGSLTLSVSTGGDVPHLSAAIRDRLASQFGPEWGILVEELARARGILKDRVADPGQATLRRQVLETLCTDCSLKLLATRDRTAWRRWFERVVEHRLRGWQTVPEIE
jgi:precorrin-2 dehydrogenase / sirohydrochlorin ferrochelatase